MKTNPSMKTSLATSLAPKSYFRIFPVVLLSLCGFLTLSACQKTPDSETAVETQTETGVQSTSVTTSVSDPQNTDDDIIVEQSATELAVENERDISLTQLENNIGADGNTETTTPNREQAIKDTQITDVKYRSAAGDALSVVFETSATGVLNAIVTLPNRPKMTLSAPEGQGNNPTYRSKDGSIELISHGGGSTVDLMQNNKVTGFDAISAEAEVVTQP
ncbi:hypothetical protein [Psychrobacter sp. 72-O-c]|uniref:hypothetical protein n=1 Tax=Psychrobacter sp. 72-O-c TaxID=2774125 RepID=UPI001D124613|nr:hypothetical protein [Psychrobacter sp. 72-O-c]